MLMANETVAQEYCTEEIPFVYRTHDNPDPEKVESLQTLLPHPIRNCWKCVAGK